jgi:hypothetical protein
LLTPSFPTALSGKVTVTIVPALAYRPVERQTLTPELENQNCEGWAEKNHIKKWLKLVDICSNSKVKL